MSHEESISLEETNKIRISLGLKPLTDDKAPADAKEKAAEGNYAQKREEERKTREQKKISDGIAKVRNKRELNASLKGATLGEADDALDDNLKWIKRARKKEKELAKKRLAELESMDKEFQADYTDKDLAGLKVSHDFEALGEGEDRILTLKDSRILDNEEDELENVEMAEEDRNTANNERKIKKRDYTGYDDDEFTAGKEGMKRSLLAKYDEDLEGSKEIGFRLGGSTTSQSRKSEQNKLEAAAAVNKSLLSIDYTKNQAMSDYLQEGDVGFKKPKTKKKRSNRRAGVDSELGLVDGDVPMEVEEKPIVPRARNLDSNFIDDDDLQAALARSRKAKVKKPKLSAEELARRITQEREDEQMLAPMEIISVDADDNSGADGEGLTFDDTSEFVRSIQYDPFAVKPEPKETKIPTRQESVKRDTSVDTPMQNGDEVIEELEAGEMRVKEEDDEEDDVAMLDAIEHVLKSAEDTELKQGGDLAGTSDEQTIGTGIASALKILRQQGILAAPDSDKGEREKVQLQRDLWLADYRQKIASRELERVKARGGASKDQAAREYENRMREQREARENLEMFKNYRPDVEIVYHDEFGRNLTPKEAWKALSHRFHGKGSGKAKTEKRLKKIAEERKKEAMASGDTPLNMNRAFQARQEKAGQAHFVLSVGNRGAVPQTNEFLDAQPLSKTGKTEKGKGKKKDTTAPAQVTDMTGFTALQHNTPLSASASPLPSGMGGVGSARDSPAPGMMKSSFARVFAESEPTSSGSSPAPTADRTKLSFSMNIGVKRKANEDAAGSPPPKRR